MSELVIQIDKIPNLDKAALVIVKGSIDAKTVIQFQRKLNSVIEDGTNRIIIDMEQVKYVNSTGLGYLINLADTVGGDSGSVVFANVQPKVKVVFDMLGLNAFFKMFNSRDQALKAVSGGAAPAAAPAPAPAAPAPPPAPARPMATPGEQTRVVTRRPAAAAPATPPPAPAPAPAAPAATGEKIQIECKLCRAVLIIEGPGTYKCPRCFAMFNFSGGDRLIFLPKRPIYPIQMTLNFTPECTEGLLSFVKLIAKQAASSNGLQGEIRGLVDSIRKHAYQGNENNIYHVQVITKDAELEMRFVDYGKPMSDRLFESIKGQVDRFEVKPHPRGGNIISLMKKLS